MQPRCARSRAFPALLVWLATMVMLGGCAGGERERQTREIAALRGQIAELKTSREATAKEIATMAGTLKALDAQSAFLVGEAKTAGEERARLNAALGEREKEIRSLQSSIEEAIQKAVAARAPTSPPPLPPLPPPARDTSPEKLYTAGMASFRADEHGQAVLDLSELVEKFPKHALAANAQYWIGEAYFRQRDFRQALGEFRKVVDQYPESAQVPEALVKIGLTYRSLKDLPRARETWERVMKEHSTSNAATQARSLLSTLGNGGRRAR